MASMASCAISCLAVDRKKGAQRRADDHLPQAPHRMAKIERTLA
jgi:hypothetical protein